MQQQIIEAATERLAVYVVMLLLPLRSAVAAIAAIVSTCCRAIVVPFAHNCFTVV